MRRLLLCYVPALDVRRIEAGAFPTVARLMRACPTVPFRALPVSENLPTIVTGAPPHVHGMWGPRLRAGDHGYAADSDGESGFMTLAEDGFAASAASIEITDIAPSIMALLGCRPPATMAGRAVFAPRRRAASREHAGVAG